MRHKSKKIFKKNRKFNFNKSINLKNLEMLPFLCALGMIFVLFQPAFNYQIAEYSFSGGDPQQFTQIKGLLKNPGQIQIKGKVGGINTNYFYLMFLALLTSIILFVANAFNYEKDNLGNMAAVLALIYAGLNYSIISMFNSQLGMFNALGGMTMGPAGIVSIITGISYFYFNK